jgi:hypothetical protein
VEESEPETEDSNQETETERPESIETGQEAVEEAPEVVEAEEPSIDELDPIKPHSDIESNDAGEIIETELPAVLTPDDAIVVSPSGPLNERKS